MAIDHGVVRLFQVAWGTILEKVAMIAEVMLQLRLEA
jgi:hypothetical protein